MTEAAVKLKPMPVQACMACSNSSHGGERTQDVRVSQQAADHHSRNRWLGSAQTHTGTRRPGGKHNRKMPSQYVKTVLQSWVLC